jgi:hypothetical protein
MNSNRIAKVMLNCRPFGQRWLGKPLKRLLDQAETGMSRPNWWRIKMMMIIVMIFFFTFRGPLHCDIFL